jgi:hypothetical protein
MPGNRANVVAAALGGTSNALLMGMNYMQMQEQNQRAQEQLALQKQRFEMEKQSTLLQQEDTKLGMSSKLTDEHYGNIMTYGVSVANRMRQQKLNAWKAAGLNADDASDALIFGKSTPEQLGGLAQASREFMTAFAAYANPVAGQTPVPIPVEVAQRYSAAVAALDPQSPLGQIAMKRARETMAAASTYEKTQKAWGHYKVGERRLTPEEKEPLQLSDLTATKTTPEGDVQLGVKPKEASPTALANLDMREKTAIRASIGEFQTKFAKNDMDALDSSLTGAKILSDPTVANYQSAFGSTKFALSAMFQGKRSISDKDVQFTNPNPSILQSINRVWHMKAKNEPNPEDIKEIGDVLRFLQREAQGRLRKKAESYSKTQPQLLRYDGKPMDPKFYQQLLEQQYADFLGKDLAPEEEAAAGGSVTNDMVDQAIARAKARAAR